MLQFATVSVRERRRKDTKSRTRKKTSPSASSRPHFPHTCRHPNCQLSTISFTSYSTTMKTNSAMVYQSTKKEEFEEQIRRDRLSRFLATNLSAIDADSAPLESAVRALARHDVKTASEILLKSRNYHLSLLVAQINDADRTFQDDTRRQIDAWKEQTMLSEMNDDVRTLYELLAGNTTVVQGILPRRR